MVSKRGAVGQSTSSRSAKKAVQQVASVSSNKKNKSLNKDSNRSSTSSSGKSKDRPWGIFDKKILKNTPTPFTHVSLFSGCGGFDLGLRRAGFETVFANDIDIDACLTYRHNLGEIIEGDIRRISVPMFKNSPDLLTAGFPCQPFSNAGLRKGLNDERGTLFQTAIDTVAKLKPRALIFENVRGLLSFKSEGRLLIEEICSQLDALGYNVVFSLLDASRHHVPQKRLRVVIVGIKRSRNHGVFSFPIPVDRSDLTLKNSILDVSPKALNQNELLNLNPQATQLGSMIPEGGSWKNIPYEKLPPRLQKIRDNIERYRWPNFYRRFHRDEIAGTITAAFKPENAGVWHPVEQRIFSVREIGRIQSFPDWFKFEGRSIKSKYQQIGNAVPPRLAYELGMQIIEVLGGKNLREDKERLTFEQFITIGKPLRARDHEVIFSKK